MPFALFLLRGGHEGVITPQPTQDPTSAFALSAAVAAAVGGGSSSNSKGAAPVVPKPAARPIGPARGP
jgi:hypothetical protein